MNEIQLLRAIGEADDRFVAEAAPAARRQPAVIWLRWAVAACACLAIFGAILALRGPDSKVNVPTHDWSQIQPIPRGPDGKPLPGPKTQPSGEEIFNAALYVGGCKTVEELVEKTVLIVRATPVAIESESNVGVCLVLEVAEASDGTTRTVKIRQLKDEYMLQLHQEVVLALVNDAGPGYYCIPGGVSGLFRFGGAHSDLQASLLQMGRAEFPDQLREANTMLEVYDCLMAAYNNR